MTFARVWKGRLRGAAWWAIAALQRRWYGLGSLGPGSFVRRTVVFKGVRRNIHIGRNVALDGTYIACEGAGSRVVIGDGTYLHPNSMLITGPDGHIELGGACSVNPFCVLYGHGGLVIADYVRIAAHTVIIPANHIFDDPDVPITRQGLSKQGISIGRDVWVGTGVRVLDGVAIGDGCVIGAGSVVTKSLPDFAVAVGAPARIVKQRAARVGEATE